MANWPYESIHDGYTIVNGSLTGTAASKISCWLEYKIVSQSVANNTSTIRFYVFLATSGNTSQFDVSCSNIDSNSRGAMSVSVDGSSVYNRIGRGFAISRIPYRDEYITQYQEPYDTALGYQYLMILTDNASTESEAYGECTVTHNSDGTTMDEEFARAITFRESQYKAGISDLMAHDCSGFLSWLMREAGIWDDRKNCDGLWALCSVVARNELISGDFLFRNSTTNSEDETHVGLYLGRGMVIHAKGRDVGVVVEGINQGGSGYWHKCGRCKLLYK